MSDQLDLGDLRRCGMCGEVKPLASFYRRREGHQYRCKPCANAKSMEWAVENPELRMLHSARHRAKKEGVAFSLDCRDIEIPKECPICGTAMLRSEDRNTSPSLDRIVPKRGYVSENVVVVCYACNRKKQNSTAEELSAMADFIYRIREERGLC